MGQPSPYRTLPRAHSWCSSFTAKHIWDACIIHKVGDGRLGDFDGEDQVDGDSFILEKICVNGLRLEGQFFFFDDKKDFIIHRMTSEPFRQHRHIVSFRLLEHEFRSSVR